MRAIMVMFDSLNKNYLPPYGNTEVYAPNFSRLAEKTVAFENCYAASLPCMPARRELHTGRYNFLHRSWGPMEPFDDSMPEILKRSGVHSHLISDHLHYWEDGGATYHQRYSTWEIVRGQEGDHWKPVAHLATPPEHLGRYFRNDFVNRQFMDTEDKLPQSKTFNHGLEFLEMNKDKDDWFLHIETFDPHEPYFTVQKYKDLYPDDYDGPHFDWPDYKEVTEGEAASEHLKNYYKAMISMCDYNLGRILDFMDENNMWEDTLLIVNTDHGFLLTEHDWWGKCIMPFYDEIANIPLFVYDPRYKVQDEMRKSLVQSIDLCPTILDFFGKTIPNDVMGKPLSKVIENDEKIRDAALFGQHGGQVNVTDGRYVYMRACATDDNMPLYEYTLMPTHSGNFFYLEELKTAQLSQPFSFTKGCPLLKTESSIAVKSKSSINQYKLPKDILADGGKPSEIYRTYLFDTLVDPKQNNPIQDDKIEQQMISLLIKKMKENDAPKEQYERLGLTIDEY